MALTLTLDLLNSKPLDSRFHGNDGQDLTDVVTGTPFVLRTTVKALNNYKLNISILIVYLGGFKAVEREPDLQS